MGNSAERFIKIHGCINLPEEIAAKLYQDVAVDTPVIAYYREPVKLTAENTKISNAYSYYDEEKEKKKEDAAKQSANRPADQPVPNEGERVAEDGSIEPAP